MILSVLDLVNNNTTYDLCVF